MDGIDTSGKALVDHWKWMGEKGLLNINTARSLGAACSQVLAVFDDWETLDVRTLDVEDAYRRFQNKRSKDFVPASLEAYKRRFASAVTQFLDYSKDPSTWKGPSSERTGRRDRAVNNQPAGPAPASSERASTPPTQQSGLIEYPFPLREGRLAYLRLPADLKSGEVKRLAAYLNTLAVDSELAV
jgi:hypothetical protein